MLEMQKLLLQEVIISCIYPVRLDPDIYLFKCPPKILDGFMCSFKMSLPLV
jgi:hypothetical protein